MKTLLARALVGIGVLVAAACSTSPLGRSQLLLLPDSQVDEMGVTAYTQLKKQTPLDSRSSVNRYVDCVAWAITRELPGDQAAQWEVSVFNEDQANAFALPGRKIGVYAGLLKVAENQSQLATVMGHEVAHVLAKHSNERVSQGFIAEAGMQAVQVLAGDPTPQKRQLFALLGVGTQVGVLLPFGRTQESEADLLGLDLMASAGFDPRESVALWRNMAKAGGGRPPEFLSTHPSGTRRIGDLNERMPHALELYEQARARGKRPDCRP